MPSPKVRTETADLRSGGFTLLELLIVAAVIAVLFGLAVGFLGKTDPRTVADSILAPVDADAIARRYEDHGDEALDPSSFTGVA